MGTEGFGESRGIVQIALNARSPTHRLAVAARQIIVDHRSVAGGGQGLAGVRADIAGAAGDEDRLRHQANTGYRWPNEMTTAKPALVFHVGTVRRLAAPGGRGISPGMARSGLRRASRQLRRARPCA